MQRPSEWGVPAFALSPLLFSPTCTPFQEMEPTIERTKHPRLVCMHRESPNHVFFKKANYSSSMSSIEGLTTEMVESMKTITKPELLVITKLL
ncbi:hypothetical protein LOK49_LG10G00805 [Camellia lanceoleosa]|uniref:Uncharacterized protein n=1 Tax=Camellia lanceoleosa TaxID=1840588 RepID=A0ACC0G7P2_9ERIC|nr:hypothetical protein LOK49_LG10G00805 [Camellia lanceoleosa]